MSEITITKTELSAAAVKAAEAEERLTSLRDGLSVLRLLPAYRELAIDVDCRLAAIEGSVRWVDAMLGVWWDEADRDGETDQDRGSAYLAVLEKRGFSPGTVAAELGL